MNRKREITCDICGNEVMDYNNQGITRHPHCEPGWKPEPIPLIEIGQRYGQRFFEFYTEPIGFNIYIGRSHINLFAHVGSRCYGERQIFYRMECPWCYGESYEPWEDSDCPFCQNQERLNIFRWLWTRLQISRANDWRQMIGHYLRTGEKVW